MARQASTKPLLSFKADPTKELKGVSVRQSLQDKLDAYALFVEQNGEAKPNRSAVMDKILERFFDEDKAFQAFFKSGRAKPATAAATET